MIRLSIRYRGVELAYRTFDKIQQGAIIENKRRGALVLRRSGSRRSARGLSSSGTENLHKARGPYLPSQQTPV
ncbi:MAG: hypothetical protein WB611_01525 [Stellaceae bacterium]